MIEAMNDEKIVDIIIPSYKPGAKFLKLISMLAKQEIPPSRLIIINTEESLMPDEIKAAIERLNGDPNSVLFGRILLKHIKKEEFDHAATRAYGVSLSDAPAFICMTDDAVPADTFLTDILLKGLYERRGPGGELMALAYARQLPGEDAGEIEAFTRSFNYPETSGLKTAKDIKELGIKAYFASNVCCAYRRDVFLKLGGFTDTAIFNEDMIYAAKALEQGYGISYEAGARVIHSHDQGALGLFHRNFDLGMSQAMHPEVFENISSEGEGIRLVKKTAAHLLRKGMPLSVIGLFWDSGFKYLGYRFGKAYKRLPYGLVHGFCSNKAFVERMYKRGKSL